MTRDEQIIAEAKKNYYDEHPANVWHDACEEPINYDTQIVYQEKSGICWFASQLDWFEYRWNWKRFVDDHQMVRWAYISDLLPKGGER